MKDKTPEKYHITEMRVPLFEIDIGQVVYHGNYFHFYNTARDEFFREMGYPYIEFMKRGEHLAIVETNCKFKGPVSYDDIIEIHTGVSWLRTRSISLYQAIFKRDENHNLSMVNEALFNMVCISDQFRAAKIPEEFAYKVKTWMNNK